MKQKTLSHYLELIKSATSKHDWKRAKRYGNSALTLMSKYRYPPLEQYNIYVNLAYSYYWTAEYSRSIDILYKAYLIAVKYHFKQADVTYTLFGMANNYMSTKNLSQALIKYQKVEQYYQEYGTDMPPMNAGTRFNNLVNLGVCYIKNDQLGKARQIIDEKLAEYENSLGSNRQFHILYSHLKGEYLFATKEYDQAQEWFKKCIAMSKEINWPVLVFDAQIHYAVIELLMGEMDSAIKILLNVIAEGKKIKLCKQICEAGLVLRACYTINGMHQKAVRIDKLIKQYLKKIDIAWFYEATREYEKLCQQLREADKIQTRCQTDIPGFIANALKEHHKNAGYENVIIGKTKNLMDIYSLIEKIAPTDLPVVIQGETGTGKELIARAIYQNSLRRKESWLGINCGAMPETLLETALFGHTKGAFTDAKGDKKGYIELASKGTLFLDEIAEMSFSMQQKLLRIMEDKLLWRVGAEKPIPVNTRFIFASNRNIEELVKAKKFRKDLYYRINTIVITLPPLRDRRDDIPLLINHFLNKYSSMKTPNAQLITPNALALLQGYPWPGNIRELENEIERICALHAKDKTITKEMLSETIRNYNRPESSPRPVSLKDARKLAEKTLIMDTIKKSNGNISQASRLLGCSRRYLHKKMSQLKI